MSEENRNITFIRIVISSVLSLVVFLLLQGLITDQIDDFIEAGIEQGSLTGMTALNFILWAYTMALLASQLISSITANRLQGIKFTRDILWSNLIAFILTILWFMALGYICIYYLYEVQINFLLGNAYFVIYVLENAYAYFFILLVVYIMWNELILYLIRRQSKNG